MLQTGDNTARTVDTECKTTKTSVENTRTPKHKVIRNWAKVAVFLTLILTTSLSLSACDLTIATTFNGTPINPFPTAVPRDNNLPTSVAPGIVVTSPPPTAYIPQLQPTWTPYYIYVTPTPWYVTATPMAPTAIPTLDNNWNMIQGGIQWRNLYYTNDSNGQGVGVLVVRMDPAKVKFGVKYTPGQAYSIRDWQARLPGAAVIVNANYFDPSKNPIGLVSTDGILYGASTGRNDSGFFQVVNGVPHVRSIYVEPYNNTERFDQLVNGFPMLMVNGFVAPAFNPDLVNTPNQRTVIAQDKYGRILFIITQYSNTSFSDMANWLGRSGLEISSAVNVDGGPSSNMYLATGGPSQFTQGFNNVPVVVAVYPR